MASNNYRSSNNGTAVTRSSRIHVRQIPSGVDWAEFRELCSKHGEVVDVQHVGTSEAPSAIVTYKTGEVAQKALPLLNGAKFHDATLQATYHFEKLRNQQQQNTTGGTATVAGSNIRQRPYGPRAATAPLGPAADFNRPSHAGDMPLRMTVDAKFVGAIIGQGGSNIRQITKESKARCVVDVQRGIRDTQGNTEKIINIFGQPENCSKAAIKILEVVQREMSKDPAYGTNQTEPELKLRAHNNLVGRLIGKGGATIKKIMEDTGCTVYVSNNSGAVTACGGGGGANNSNAAWNSRGGPNHPSYYSIGELSAFNMERTITIRGAIESIAKAEAAISSKLRQCWEHDMGTMPQSGLFHPLAAMTTIPPMPVPMQYAAAPAMPPPLASTMFPGIQYPPTAAMPAAAALQPQLPQETAFMFVPNNIVGALIGTKGAHIRQVMRMTGASIRIDTQEVKPGDVSSASSGVSSEGGGGGGSRSGSISGPHNTQQPLAEPERMVTITGTEMQQYKAQFWVYQKVAEIHYCFFEEVRLCTEVKVPSGMVGRLIGKGGQNVKELQRATGAQVKIPEDHCPNDPEHAVVRIIAPFQASQTVQAKVRALVQQFHAQQMRGGGGAVHATAGGHQQHKAATSTGNSSSSPKSVPSPTIMARVPSKSPPLNNHAGGGGEEDADSLTGEEESGGSNNNQDQHSPATAEETGETGAESLEKRDQSPIKKGSNHDEKKVNSGEEATAQ